MLGRLLARIARDLLRGRPPGAAAAGTGRPQADDVPSRARADALLAAGDDAAAAALYRGLLSLAPNDADALCGLGIAQARMGQHREARASLERARRTGPPRGDVLNALAALHREAGEPAVAVDILREALALDARSARLRASLARALREAGRTEEAVASARQAVAIAPERAEPHVELAVALEEAGCPGEARGAVDRALALDPEDAAARMADAFDLLRRGDFARGWPAYEWRFRTEQWGGWKGLPYRPWQGEPLAGRSLLVVGEQGLGDQIMFASCLPDLLEAGARCALECDPRLVGLLQRSFPQASVHPATEEGRRSALAVLGEPDYAVPMGSVPGLLGRGVRGFPDRRAWLRADPARIDAWRARLADLPAGPRIGVSWRGGLAQTRRVHRSVDPAELAAALAGAGAAVLVDLQYGDTAADLAAMRAASPVPILHWPGAIADYEETAALAVALDGIVTVCTSLVHLAGALGRPVHVLVPSIPEWRYLAVGERMPWYPTVRLFRRAHGESWAGPIGRAAAHLPGRNPA